MPADCRHLVLLVLLAATCLCCGGGQQQDLADFWLRALPDPLAVLEPWPPAPPPGVKATETRIDADLEDIAPFVAGPPDAAEASHTLTLRDSENHTLRLHLRLAPGVALPFVQHEIVRLTVFTRRDESGLLRRGLTVAAQRPPSGTGAFRVVLAVAVDDVIPEAALPKGLGALARTEQVAYREARKDEGECTLSTTHYWTTHGADPGVGAPRRKTLLPPGGHWRRTEAAGAYEVVIHDARRRSVAPCPRAEETALLWSAVWQDAEPEAAAGKARAAAADAVTLPQAPTPTQQPPGPARSPRPGRKAARPPAHDATGHARDAVPVDKATHGRESSRP